MATYTTPAGLPATVKTILQEDYQSTSLTLKETPFPQPSSPTDVLLKVHATAPCKGELIWGKFFPQMIPAGKLPVVSQEISGAVVAAPANTGFTAGDEVYGRITFTRPGGAREYTIADASELAKKPASLSALEAAATPLSALTAWQALFVHGGLDAQGLKGDQAARAANNAKRVIITGAAGGVGRMATQLASLAGAGAVVAVSSGGDAELRELGATEVVDYRAQSVGAWAAAEPAAREADLVVDGVGGASTAECWRAVKNGGTLLCLSADPNASKPEGLEGKDEVKAQWFLVEASGKNLEEISGLIDGGKLRPTIDSVWEFGQYAEAFERLESGKAKGKIVIKVEGSA